MQQLFDDLPIWERSGSIMLFVACPTWRVLDWF